MQLSHRLIIIGSSIIDIKIVNRFLANIKKNKSKSEDRIGKKEQRILKELRGVIESAVEKSLSKDNIHEVMLNNIPHGRCWLCSGGISKNSKRATWKGMLFCSEDCVRIYAQLVNKPDVNYKYIDGEPINIIKNN